MSKLSQGQGWKGVWKNGDFVGGQRSPWDEKKNSAGGFVRLKYASVQPRCATALLHPQPLEKWQKPTFFGEGSFEFSNFLRVAEVIRYNTASKMVTSCKEKLLEL